MLKRPRRGGRCLATTTATIITTAISWGEWSPSSSAATSRWPLVLEQKFTGCGGKRMKKTAKHLKVSTGTAEAFLARSVDRARKLDRGEKLPAELRLTFEDPADLLRALTVQRVRVLHAVRKRPAPVSDLANVLKRDRTAVKRDVKILTSLGLLKSHEETNPGHGRRRIVEPLASKYELVATI